MPDIIETFYVQKFLGKIICYSGNNVWLWKDDIANHMLPELGKEPFLVLEIKETRLFEKYPFCFKIIQRDKIGWLWSPPDSETFKIWLKPWKP